MGPLAPLCVVAMLAVACDQQTAPQSPEPQPGPGVEQITGRERIGWDQPASTAADLAALRYLVHVDGNAGVELQSVTCGDTPGALGFPCDAQLPSLTVGAHSLALSSFVDAGSRLESAKSTTLGVFVLGQRMTSTSAAPAAGSVHLATADGVSLRADTIAVGLSDPTDLVALPDSRLLIAERSGAVRIIAANAMQTTPAVTLDDVVTTGDQGLLALTVDSEFGSNQYVYAAYSADRGLRLTRFRAIGNRLYDRVVLIDGVAASALTPASTLRFGPDRRLYWGVDDGGDPAAAGDLGTFSGKLLRLNRDATTPADQAGGTPVYVRSMQAPRSVDWSTDGAMWVLDAQARGTGGVVNLVIRESDGARRGAVVARYGLPADVSPQDLVVYNGNAIPAFRGDLFVADDAGASIVRLRREGQGGRTVAATERLLNGRIASARALAAGVDGTLYLATGDAVVRLAPAAHSGW